MAGQRRARAAQPEGSSRLFHGVVGSTPKEAECQPLVPTPWWRMKPTRRHGAAMPGPRKAGQATGAGSR